MSPQSPDRAARVVTTGVLVVIMLVAANAHDVTTRVTWNREISRIVYARCGSCHHPGAKAFSLLTYQEAAPWAAAIKDQVIQRQMPPWGAVKGFGAFRNEQALGQEEIDLICHWVDGGLPEGNPDHLPPRLRVDPLPDLEPRKGEMVLTGDYTFERPFVLDGFRVESAAMIAGARITVSFPDGRVEPLVWLHGYRSQSAHPFLLRRLMLLPRGAVIRGLGAVRLVLIPAAPAAR